MANALNANPIVLDTTGATSTITGQMNVSTLVWTGYTGGAALEITNAVGSRTLFKLTGTATYQPLVLNFPNGFSFDDGLNLKTLGSGTVYLYDCRK